MRVSVAFIIVALAFQAQSAQFAYDALNRLTRASYADGTSISYSYDSAGNRLSQVISNPAIAQPAVGVDKTSLSFSATAGQSFVTPQTIAIQNAGGGSLQWYATASEIGRAHV